MQTASTIGNLGPSGQNLGRILLASYFMAVALGLIAGTDVSVLAYKLLPPSVAEYAGNIVVFGLAYLVMIGIWLRPAALLLALTMFWSSYISHFSVEIPVAVDGFWRDLALIGALFLAYAHSDRTQARNRALFRWIRKVRSIQPANVAPRRVMSQSALREKITPIAPRIAARDAPETKAETNAETKPETKPLLQEPPIENIFVDYLDDLDTAFG